MHKLVITINDFETRFSESCEALKKSFEVYAFPSLPAFLEQEHLPHSTVEALFLAADPLSGRELADMPSLKVVAKMGSGIDNIDLTACEKHNIRLFTSKGQNANAVAEMTLCLMLTVLRHVLPLSHAAQNGNWNLRMPGSELCGKRVGLVGFGMISQRVAELLAPFRVSILSYDPFWDEEAAVRLHVSPVSFEELLERSDIVSVHIPALPENQNLFNSDIFMRMKKGAVFINCSRGSLVNEKDLFTALDCGHLCGAGCDVFAIEPLPAGNPLFSLPNFVGTPHLAGMTKESMYADSMAITKQLIDFFHSEEGTQT